MLLGGLGALLLMAKKKGDAEAEDIEPEILDSVEEGEAIEEEEKSGQRPPAPKPDTKPGKIPGDPPNMSGHPWGYNAVFFPNSLIVRANLRNHLGHTFPLIDEPPPPAQMKGFQALYNTLTGPKFPGVLHNDGIAGKHTLNALERFIVFKDEALAQL